MFLNLFYLVQKTFQSHEYALDHVLSNANAPVNSNMKENSHQRDWVLVLSVSAHLKNCMIS